MKAFNMNQFHKQRERWLSIWDVNNWICIPSMISCTIGFLYLRNGLWNWFMLTAVILCSWKTILNTSYIWSNYFNCYDYDDAFIFTLLRWCLFQSLTNTVVQNQENESTLRVRLRSTIAIGKLEDWRCAVEVHVFFYFGKHNSMHNRLLAFFLSL